MNTTTKTSPTHYPVFVLCGSDPERRKLLQVIDPEEKYPSKALLPFLGKRVIDWQLEALSASPYVQDIYLIGLSAEEAPVDIPVEYIPCQTTSSVLEKLETGLSYLREHGQEPKMIVVSTADTPGIRTDSINTFLEALSRFQGYNAVITGVPIEATKEIFPDHGRVVAYLQDHHLYPGDMFSLSPNTIEKAKKIIHDLAVRRRNYDRQAKNISLAPILRYIARKPRLWLMIFKYLVGKLSLSEAEESLSKAFGLRLKAVIIPDPGFGMDMDLPEDYERLKAYVRDKVELGT